MKIKRNPFHKVEEAETIDRHCAHCNNDTSFYLAYRKEGFGISPPIVGLFTDALDVARKQYYMACPICGAVLPISKDMALGLIGG